MKIKLQTIFLVLICYCYSNLYSKVPESGNIIKFAGEDNVLFIGDSKSSTIFSYQIKTNNNPVYKFGYNLDNLSNILTNHLKVNDKNYIIRSLAIHPISKEAYLALDVVNNKKYDFKIVIVNQKGDIRNLDLLKTPHSFFEINNAPTSSYLYWEKTPMRTFTFTDIDYHKGKLYISGMSNAEFSSILRVIDYPFNKKIKTTSIEIFHGIHNQTESRAPIQTLSIINIENIDYILAAYTCTPLVLIPIHDLKDGAHIRGKTIADMGYGNTPIDMLPFKGEDANKNTFDAILLTNKNRSAQMITLKDIIESAKNLGITKNIGFAEKAGTPSITLPMTGLIRIDNMDDYRIVALRRNSESGNLELVSFIKNLWLRLDDAISEYNQPGYIYNQDYQINFMKPIQDFIKQDLVKP